MADNVAPEAVVSAAAFTFATDDITTVHYPISKLAHGALNSATIVSTASGLPVQQQGSWVVDSHAVTNVGTFAVQIDAGAVTSLALLDDVIATLGTTTYTETTTKGTIIGAVRRDADTTLVDTTNEVGPLQMDANGRLKVEAFSGEALPVTLTSTTVTGTVAVTQSGAWDEVGINDSGNSITVDNPQLSVVGTGVEATAMRVTIATDSTGLLSVDDNGGSLTVDGTVAVTNGGTFATQVDGAALTALQLIDDTVQVLGTDVYTETTSKGLTLGAVRRDADTTLVGTTNEFGPLQMDANGRLKVEAFSGEALPVTLTSTTVTGTVAVTQSGTWDEVGINDSGNSITVDNPQLSVVGTGTEAAAMRVTIATDSTGLLSVDDNGGSLTVDGTVTINAIPAGTNNIGDVDVLTIAAGTNAIGNVGLVGRTTGGMSIHKSLDIDESEEEVKATAGQLFTVIAFNSTAAPLFLKFYNDTAANVIVGTTVPVITLMVPANADSDGAGFVWQSPIGFAFSAAITVACTTAIADADVGAPSANACSITLGFV